MLMYTAELKRPIKEHKSSKKAAVDGLIDDLGLDACRNVRIGNAMNRGISGGQARTAHVITAHLSCLEEYDYSIMAAKPCGLSFQL